MNNVLLTGGSGLLGKEILKYRNWYAPSHKKLDITNPKTLKGNFNIIIHCAGYTNVVKAEIDKKTCFNINVIGTLNLLKAYPNSIFVYISSEYAYKPINYYSETKRAGEMATEALAKKYLIIRTLFKSRPFPYKKAFFDQYTQGDYVDTIVPLLLKAISDNKQSNKIIYVGTGRKTMLELAQKSISHIPATSVRLVKGVKLPIDYV